MPSQSDGIYISRFLESTFPLISFSLFFLCVHVRALGPTIELGRAKVAEAADRLNCTLRLGKTGLATVV